MRVVLDPNVLVSAVVASGVSAELLDRWLTDRPFELVVSPMLIGELRDVLERPNSRVGSRPTRRQASLTGSPPKLQSWDDPTDVPSVTGDPKDDYLAAL